MPTASLSVTFPDADSTAAHAVVLGASMQAGDVVLLSGDVGAGKTHFVRSLIQSQLTVPEDVPSPTFTLVQTYETKLGEIWHADLYRLTDTQEIEELGLAEAFEIAVCFIEWPDRLGDLTPPHALSLHFAQGACAEARAVVAEWQDPKWRAKLSGWQK